MKTSTSIVSHGLLGLLLAGCGANTGSGDGSGNNGNGDGGFSVDFNQDAGRKPGPGGNGGASGNNATDNAQCGFKKYVLQRQPADLMLVLDRSGSMKDSLKGSAVSKWLDTTAALEVTIKTTDATVNWGLKSFPTGIVECSVADGIDVNIAPANYSKVSPAIMMEMPEGKGTPTRMAIGKTLAHMKTLTTPNPKYLVLATDGQPNCADDMSSKKDDAPGAIAAIDAAAKSGFHTFVVGIATAGSTANTTLNSMAEKGLEPRAGETKYYAVASKQDLVDALAKITGLVGSCLFPLDNAPPSPNDVAVKIDGKLIPRDTKQMNGWDYGADTKSVRLYGAACDTLKATATDQTKVDITFGCPGVVIP
jgi:hypothetical protein